MYVSFLVLHTYSRVELAVSNKDTDTLKKMEFAWPKLAALKISQQCTSHN